MGKNTVYTYDNSGNLTLVTKYLSGRAINTSLGYDAWNNAVTVTDPKNNTTKYTYDMFNRNNIITYPLTGYGDSRNATARRVQNYNYKTNTLIIVDEDGNKSYQKFDMSNRIIESGYDDGVSKKVLNKIFYDGAGNVVKSIDGEGNIVTNQYDERFKLTKVNLPTEDFFDPDTEATVYTSSYVRYQYDGNGYRTKEFRKDFDGELSTSFTRNSIGQTLITESDGVTNKSGFDNNGNQRYIIDGKGTLTTLDYNALNQMKSQSVNGVTTKFEYDKLGNLQKMIDPRQGLFSNFGTSYTIDYHYDDLYRLYKADLPKSYGQSTAGSISFAYDDNGNVTTKTDVDSVVTNYLYNKRNMLLTEYTTTTSSATKKFAVNYAYNNRGLVTKSTDASNLVTSTDYTPLGQVDSVTRGSVTESFKYDLNGNLITSTDGRGKITTNNYDAYNRIFSVVNANSETISYGYDLSGNRTYFSDGNNNRTTYSFDKLNRMVREKSSRGFTSGYTYDAVGNIKSKEDFNGSKFSYEYDAFYNLDNLTVKDSNDTLRKKVDYTYDVVGGLMDAVEEDYDDAGSVTNSVSTSYNYVSGGYVSDPFNRVFNISTNVNGVTSSIDYSYDIAGRVTSLTYPDNQAVTSSYNIYGQLKTLGDYTSTDSINYKANGMLSSYSLGNGVNYTANYDDNSRLDDFNYSINSQLIDNYDFSYDDSNNIISKVVNGQTSSYDYDDINQLIFAHNEGEFNVDPSELDSKQDIGVVKEDYDGAESLDFSSSDTELKLDYNSVSIGFDLGSNANFKKFVIKPRQVTDRLKSNKLGLYISDDNFTWRYVRRADWKFNFVGNTAEVEMFESIKTRYVKLHCFYDDLDEDGFAKDLSEVRNSKETLLTAFFTVSSFNEFFDYDSAGNRTNYDKFYSTIDESVNTSYSYYNNSNLIKSNGKFAYVWDNNGNLIKKGDKFTINGDSVSFSSTEGTITTYNYDLLNRLVNVTITNLDEPELSNSVDYTYDHRGYRLKRTEKDKRPIYYTFGLSGEILYKDNQHTRTQENFIYLFGKHLAKEVIKNNSAKERLYFHTDHLGSTIAITNREGNKVWDNNYSVFGESLKESGTLDEEAIYTGKEKDPITGLYYFNARWYDPTLARFITEDPIKDGANWYMYCLNNPLRFIDPTGLQSKDPSLPRDDNGNVISVSGQLAEDSKWTEDEIKEGKKSSSGSSSSSKSENESNLDLKTADELEVERLQTIIDDVLENIADLKYDPYDWRTTAMEEILASGHGSLDEVLDEMIDQKNSPFEFVDRDTAKRLLLNAFEYNKQGDTLYLRGIKGTINYVTSPFGGREAPVEGVGTNHKGIDTVGEGSKISDPIIAGAEGTVVRSEKHRIYGHMLVMKHSDGEHTMYAHLSGRAVKVGEKFKVGQTVGFYGNSGKYTSGPHLHTEIRMNGKPLDPTDRFLN